MSGRQSTEHSASISVRNVGGIDETTAALEPGVNVLVGRNATNRTSLLQGLIAALGGEDVSIKGDADEAAVELELGEAVYRRELSRGNGTVVTSGEPYLADPELGELFAFLLESNEARRAVATGRDLRDLIMRPVDTEEIRAEIAALESEKAEIAEEIEAVEERTRDLPDLESELSRLEDEIDRAREDLAETESAIAAADADVEAEQAEQAVLDEKLEALRDARADLEDLRYEIDRERRSIQSLAEDRSTLRTELDALPEAPEAEREALAADLDRLRERRRALETEISSLQNTVQFNEEMLGGERTDVAAALGTSDGSVTDDLDPDDEVVCWTCGSAVERSRIEGTLDHLRDLREQKLAEKRDLSDELDELKADKQSLERQRERRQEYRARLAEVTDELEQRRARLEDRQDERETLEGRVQSLEAEVEDLESDQFDDLLELHREANDLEYELGRLENDREAVEAEIEAVEQAVARQSDLAAERERVTDRLEELRTRVETLEREAVEAFNDHMDEVLEALDYDNLDRVWIERVQREVRDGRQKAIETFFELHVVRSTPSGATYEDTVDHLSESEREVTGLVFALAGYLLHDVHDEVPFMLLDSLEAIDSARIAELVSYFAAFADFLVVALLEEDANALDTPCNRIESI